MFRSLLPRHFDIICEINRRFLDEVAHRWPGDAGRIARMSIFEEGEQGGWDDKRIRMANLALVGSHSVNGVAALHSDLLERDLFHDFHELWPKKLRNVTNGVTQRRWLLQANPALARLINESIGERWITDLDALTELIPLADDSTFRETWSGIKRLNARVLAKYVEDRVAVGIDPDSLFDVQVKRIHEYKRQLMNVLRVFVFGMTEAEVTALRAQGYRPRDYYESNAELRRVIDLIRSGAVSGGDAERYAGLMDNLLDWDPYLVLADFADYLEAQDAAARAFRDQAAWARMSILNVANMGRFSSDRCVSEYAEGIWGIAPLCS